MPAWLVVFCSVVKKHCMECMEHGVSPSSRRSTAQMYGHGRSPEQPGKRSKYPAMMWIPCSCFRNIAMADVVGRHQLHHGHHGRHDSQRPVPQHVVHVPP